MVKLLVDFKGFIFLNQKKKETKIIFFFLADINLYNDCGDVCQHLVTYRNFLGDSPKIFKYLLSKGYDLSKEHQMKIHEKHRSELLGTTILFSYNLEMMKFVLSLGLPYINFAKKPFYDVISCNKRHKQLAKEDDTLYSYFKTYYKEPK